VALEAVSQDWELAFASEEELAVAFERDLKRGRTMVTTAKPSELQAQGVLAIQRQGGRYELKATVVWRSPDAVTLGLQFDAWDETRVAELQAFVEAATRKRSNNLYDRVRGLTQPEQQALARTGGQAERVALERCFGGSVWESLLQNPHVTAPEIASLAKKGSLSRPLVAQIANNAAWLAIPEVQRALLTNPRLDSALVPRVLKAMPRAEVQLGLMRATSLRQSRRVTSFLFGDGRLGCWGNNSYGQLAIGETGSRGDPPGQMGDALPFAQLGAGDVSQVALGLGHACSSWLGEVR
jgi:hypothetical protein